MLNIQKDDTYYMRMALGLANLAFAADEVPVGCIIVSQDGTVIGRAHNQVETLKDATAHAEMIALTQAQAFKGSKWLNGCSVYVTIEPCLMCTGAFILARVSKICFGAFEHRTGALGSMLDSMQLEVNHRFTVTSSVLEAECAYLMQDFFRKKRNTSGDLSDCG